MTKQTPNTRYFYALAFCMPTHDTSFEKTLASLKQSQHDASIDWIRPPNLHCTLRYLGHLDPKKLDSLHHAMTTALSSSPCLDLVIDTITHFPSLEKPYHLVLLPQPQSALTQLATTINQIVCAQNLTPDRFPFRPHITVAHLDGPPPSLTRMLPIKLPFIPWRAKYIHLYSSQPSMTPNDYRIEASISLIPYP